MLRYDQLGVRFTVSLAAIAVEGARGPSKKLSRTSTEQVIDNEAKLSSAAWLRLRELNSSSLHRVFPSVVQ